MDIATTITESAEKAKAKIDAILMSATKLISAVSPGKIMPMPKVPNPDATYWHGGASSSFRSPAAAREHLNKMKAEADAVRAECKVVCENNEKVYQAIHTFLTTAGFQTQERQLVPRSRTNKTEWASAGWVQSLGRQIPRGDPMFTFDGAYDRSMKYIDDWSGKLEATDAQKRREQEAVQKKAQLEQTIGALAVKYEVPLPASTYDVMQAILSKNKYLRLAHYLAKNRGDWSEGCDYARIGLDDFKAETPDDHAMSEELWALCNDWDGDGRVFRDCNWNYERLFGMVGADAPNLMLDYTQLKELLGE